MSSRRRRSPTHRRHRIPPLQQAIHSVSNLDFLDLYASIFSLQLGRVVKIWKLRDTQRPVEQLPQQCPVFSGPTQSRILFGSREEDGPFAAGYKQALTIEMQQVLLDGQPITNTSTQKNRHVRIFFYGSYAEKASKWLKRNETTSKTQPFLVSLNNVPGICITPFSLDPSDWYDQDRLLDVCICIGDNFNLTVTQSEDDPSPLRLDSEQMEVRLTTQNCTEDTEDLILRSDLFIADGTSHCDTKQLSKLWTKERPQDETEGEDRPTLPPSAPATPTRLSRALADSIRERAAEVDAQAAKEDCNLTHTTGLIDSTTAPPETEGNSHAQRVETPRPQIPKRRPDSMTFEGPAQKRTRPEKAPLHYSRLGQLSAVYQAQGFQTSVNIYAVVLGFTAPTQPKRGDWMMVATLVDDSCYEHPLTLIMFAKTIGSLPALRQMGDVLRLHRGGVKEYNGDIQIQGLKACSYVVVRKTSAEGWKVVPSSSPYYVFESTDEKVSQSLWFWGQTLVANQPTIHEEHRFTLGDMVRLDSDGEENMSNDRDLTVMMTAKYPYPPVATTGITPCGFIRVWDGTGIHPSDPLLYHTLATEMMAGDGDPPSTAVQRIAAIVKTLLDSKRERDLETPKGLCGRSVNCVIWETPHWELIKALPIGSFLRLRNVTICAWQKTQFRSLMVGPKSWLTPLPDETYEIRQLLREHNKRVLRNEFNPKSGLLPNLTPEPPAQEVARVEGVGSGLSAFIRSFDQDTFEGKVQILETIPMFNGLYHVFCKTTQDGSGFCYRFGVTMADDSCKATAIVDDTGGLAMFGMPASVAVGLPPRQDDTALDGGIVWLVELRKTIVRGRRYLVVTNIEEFTLE